MILVIFSVSTLAVVAILMNDENPPANDLQAQVPQISLNASAQTDHIQLTWNRISKDNEIGLIRFKIYRAYDGQDFILVASVDLNQTSYADHSVTRYRTCLYRVEAVQSQEFLESRGSNFVNVGNDSGFISLGTRASDPPRDLVGRPSDGKVALSWNLPLVDGGHWITSFSIYRGTSPDNLCFIRNTTMDPDEFVNDFYDEGLTNNVTYFYAVRADNSIRESNRSDMASVTPLPGPQISISRLSPETEYDHQLLRVDWNISKEQLPLVTTFKLYLFQGAPPEPGPHLIGVYNSSLASSFLVDLKSPHQSGILYMVVEYQGQNISYSDPFPAAISAPVDAPIGGGWSDLLILVPLFVGVLVAAIILMRSLIAR